MQASAHDLAAIDGSPADPADATLRNVDRTRLYGFALLLWLGDRRGAAQAATDALAEGKRHRKRRDPARAAAWLRRRVTDRARSERRTPLAAADARRTTLAALGVDTTTLQALAELDIRRRAALIASTIEGFDRRGMAIIVGLDGQRLDRCVHSARLRFLAATSSRQPSDVEEDGPIVGRIKAITARALG